MPITVSALSTTVIEGFLFIVLSPLLAFYRANINSFGKVFLEEGIYQQDGHTADNRQRHLHRHIVQSSDAHNSFKRVQVPCVELVQVVEGNLNVVLQGPQIVSVSHVQERVEPAVPMPYHGEQTDCRHNRHRHRQNYTDENRPFVCPVNRCRLFDFFGQAFEELLDYDNVPNVHNPGDDVHPNGIRQVQLFDYDVGRNHTAAEQDAEQNQFDNQPFPGQVVSRYRIRQH